MAGEDFEDVSAYVGFADCGEFFWVEGLGDFVLEVLADQGCYGSEYQADV